MTLEQPIIQISGHAPNPVTGLSGYTPTTNHWELAIAMTNVLIQASANSGFKAKMLQKGANVMINDEIFTGEKTAEQWAEFVMSINHVLWLLHGINEQKGIEYLDPVLEALNDLYYEWHDKALNTLKEDDLSTYLRITD